MEIYETNTEGHNEMDIEERVGSQDMFANSEDEAEEENNTRVKIDLIIEKALVPFLSLC